MISTRRSILSVNGLLDGLAAYWPLAEASGTRNDAHGNALHLSDYGSVTFGTGLVYASAAAYNMATDQWLYRDRASSAAINFSGSFSILAWTYPTAFDGGPDSPSYYRMIASFNYGSAFGGGYKIQTTSAGQIYVALGANSNQGWTWHVPGPNCTLNQWQLIAWTFDYASGVVAAGINGELQTTVNPNPAYFKPASSGEFSVGAYSGGAAHVFDGRLGPLAMWNRALTQSEIYAFYNNGAGVTYEDIAAGC